jgi:DNA transformation protein
LRQSLPNELLHDLASLGALRARRMFGGIRIYCDDVFFALIWEGILYFKCRPRRR